MYALTLVKLLESRIFSTIVGGFSAAISVTKASNVLVLVVQTPDTARFSRPLLVCSYIEGSRTEQD
jgi:hypothetical protein